MEIGEPKKRIEIVPVEEPVPTTIPIEEPAQAPVEEPIVDPRGRSRGCEASRWVRWRSGLRRRAASWC